MSVINGFIKYYTQRLEFYREAARVCAQLCETNMEQIGIRTIVTSRAKKTERLRDKLLKRDQTKKYTSFEEIMEDIADLSGVRIALYFPGDLYKVQQFIEASFQVKECRTFPEVQRNPSDEPSEYRKRFTGYWATHYRIYMKGKNIPEEAKKYSDTLIEIQIASVLMHAWSEVEHDLVYKPYSGEVSYEEYQILDELNGLVLAGEIALERLQKAVKNRVSEVGQEFNNHYELAMFLYNKLGSASEASRRNTVLGRVDLLYQCIKASDYNKPENLKELLVHVDTDTKNKPVVDQIIDRIKEKHPQLYERYLDVKQSEELKYQLDTLQMHRENGNRQGEANTLANIGYIYSSKENYEEAIGYFSKAVQINHEIGGIQGEANQLLNLGSTYRLKGNLDKALEYCNQAALLHQQINYKQGQANAFGIIANIFSDRGKYDEALKYYTDAIEIYRETNYKLGEANQLNHLGAFYKKQGENEKALECYQEALAISNCIDYKNAAEEARREIDSILDLT
jgi:ppGpp synthetase/RelA/SpoT-type nucleotidyltranferase